MEMFGRRLRERAFIESKGRVDLIHNCCYWLKFARERLYERLVAGDSSLLKINLLFNFVTLPPFYFY